MRCFKGNIFVFKVLDADKIAWGFGIKAVPRIDSDVCPLSLHLNEDGKGMQILLYRVVSLNFLDDSTFKGAIREIWPLTQNAPKMD